MTGRVVAGVALPAALYRAADVRELDRRAIEDHGIAGYALMTRAGEAAFTVLRERWPKAKRVSVCCGVGNNAGDGYVVARLAQQAGLQVILYAVGDPAQLKGDAATARDDAGKVGVVPEPFNAGALHDFDVVVDALLGTGLDRPVAGHFAAAVNALNGSGRPVLAVDIPSGLQADSGAVGGRAVRSEATITYIGLKRGLFTHQGPSYCGAVYFSDLGVPRDVFSGMIATARRVDYDAIMGLLGPRPRAAHKGSYGHVLVVGGAPAMSGAARMAGEAAARVGAGLVSVATHPQHAPFLNIDRPELMVHGVADGRALRELLPRANCVVIGPGLGQGGWGNECLGAVLDSELPLVVDADGLNLLAQESRKRANWVLTPHPGEASRLLACSVGDINSDRFAAARRLAEQRGGVIVLKGAGTLICEDEMRPMSLSTEGNPGMASGGMGDVLSGVIGGLIAQGFTLEAAARIGVCLHGEAADCAAVDGERGMLAGDLFPHLRRLANPPAHKYISL